MTISDIYGMQYNSKHRVYNIINNISGRKKASSISFGDLIDKYGNWEFCGGYENGEISCDGVKIHNVVAYKKGDKKMNHKMISVCVYADTTGLFSEYECDQDNLTYIDFPEKIVREWYEKEGLVEDTSIELDKPIEECTFEDWYKAVYTAEHTDGLYAFAESKGYVGNVDNDVNAGIFWTDCYGNDHIVYTGTVSECRMFGKEHDWELNEEVLDIKAM